MTLKLPRNTPERKACVDCIHSRRSVIGRRWFFWKRYGTNLICERPLEWDTLTGAVLKRLNVLCFDERQDPQGCGIRGEYQSPIPW